MIHGGVDGYSRIPIYLQASDNKRAATVCLASFFESSIVTGIFVLLKTVLGLKFSENFYPIRKIFVVRKVLSHQNKICTTEKFSGKDEIRAKASLASQTSYSSSSIRLSGKVENGVWITRLIII